MRENEVMKVAEKYKWIKKKDGFDSSNTSLLQRQEVHHTQRSFLSAMNNLLASASSQVVPADCRRELFKLFILPNTTVKTKYNKWNTLILFIHELSNIIMPGGSVGCSFLPDGTERSLFQPETLRSVDRQV